MAGEVVGIVATNSIEFVEATFRCQHDSQVSVPLRGPGDQARIAVAGIGRVITPGQSTGWRRSVFAPTPGGETVQILFTSGTTGAEKGVMLTRSNIASTTGRLNAVMGLDDSIREYIGVPVYYSFGLGRCRAVSAVRGEYYLPPDGFNPSEIAAMLKRGEINALSAVPTQWRLLLQHADLLGAAASRLRWIEVGSQPMSRGEKERLKQRFPSAVIVQHYGLTEASRTTFLRIHETEGEALESVGRAEGLIEVRTNPEGRILIRGPHVAPSVLSAAGPMPLLDADGWLTTNDLGAMHHGFLHFEGRADDLINCAGVKLFPEALESGLHDALGSSEGLAVARFPDGIRGDGILVSFTARPGWTDETVRNAAVRVVQAMGIQAAGAIAVQSVAEIPRTTTGKVRRQELSDRYARDHGTLSDRLMQIWKDTLGVDAVRPDDTLFDLGGSPKSARELIPRMEAAGVSQAGVQGMLDGLTVAEVLQLSEPEAEAPEVEARSIERQILEIWQKALGRSEIGLHKSFYDIGGDSLSAITVALQMERAGLDPQLARGIFAGKTIAALAEEITAGRAAAAAAAARASGRRETVPAPRLVKTPLAGLSESLNFVKGIVLLCMLSSHWIPVYIESGGPSYAPLRKILSPIFSLGSPTLGFAFGLGTSIFVLRLYQHSRTSFLRSIRTMSLFLTVGLVIGGAAEISSAVARGQHVGLADALLLLYGPFAYFLPATLSLPLWLRFVKRTDAGVMALLYASAAAYLLYVISLKYLPEVHESHVIMGLSKALAGHWSLFQMAAITLFGAAVGLMIDRRIRGDGKIEIWFRYGFLMFVMGGILSVVAFDFDSWFRFPKPITFWSILAYSGIALMIIAKFERVMNLVRGLAPIRGGMEIICCLGILLFPLYVLQSVVYHSATIISTLSTLSFVQALSLCIVAFLLVTAYLVGRLYGLHYRRLPRLV